MNVLVVKSFQMVLLILATLHSTKGRAVGDMEDFYSYDTTTRPLRTKNSVIEGLMNVFDDILDKSPKDGSLTQEEFEMADNGFQSALDWEQRLKIWDKNCDGAISKKEFRLMGDMDWDIVSLDKNNDVFISKEELGDDETWKSTLKYQQIIYNQEPAIHSHDYARFLAEKMIESAVPCASPSLVPGSLSLVPGSLSLAPASPSLAPVGPLSQQMEMLFDVDEGGNKPDDALDRIVVYRVSVAGRTLYYKGQPERINSMEV